MWAVSEYGAGASIYFHSEKPVRMDHTEEYQALLAEIESLSDEEVRALLAEEERESGLA